MASRISGGACSTPSAVASACLKSGSPAGCDCHFQLPDCVFNSATLAELELSSGMEVVAPKSVRLPRLKKLHLSSARRTDPFIAVKLISGCPALEVLCLSGCTLGSFKISSGTLKTLSITGCRHEGIHVSAPNTCYLRLSVFEGKAKVQIAGMPCLVSAWVFVCPDGAKFLDRGGHDLVAALCNAQQLELLGFSSILQDMMENSDEEAPAFCNLKSLVIHERLVADFYSGLAYFLQFAPNLASLILDRWTLHKWKFHEIRLYSKMIGQVSMENKSSGNLKLVPAFHRDLEVLRIRLSKDDDEIEEFQKLRGLLNEKIKAKVMAVVWF